MNWFVDMGLTLGILFNDRLGNNIKTLQSAGRFDLLDNLADGVLYLEGVG
jgi:hypothetical protein